MARRKARSVVVGALAAAGLAAVVTVTARPGMAATSARQAARNGTGPVCTSTQHRRLAARMARDIGAAIGGRSTATDPGYDPFAHVSVAVRDNYVGLDCWYHMRQAYFSASAVKATILAALLREAQERHRSLTSWERVQAWRMITQSDNNAASALWNHVGMRRLQHFLDLASMRQTVLNTWGAWGLTDITAFDETKLLRLLEQPNRILTGPSRRYELYLMSRVIPGQAWGVRTGVPTWYSWHIKNGWAPLPYPASPWVVNSIGCFLYKGRGYSIVVLTDHNPGHGPDYGIATIEAIAGAINHDLHPRANSVWPAMAPWSAWQTPDEHVPAPGTTQVPRTAAH